MKYKPQIVIALAVLLMMEPIIKVLFFKASFGFEWDIIIQNIFALGGIKNIFNFWFLFPLSGIAILIYRKWSYICFLILQAYSLYIHLTYESYTWPYISKQPTTHSYVMVAISLFLAVYFILPEVRKPYFVKNMRWWEQAPRYKTQLSCLIHFQGDMTHETRILNISRTGCFVEGMGSVELSSIVNLSIPEIGDDMLVTSKVVSHHQFNGVKGVGMQFVFNKQGSEKDVKGLVKRIKNESQSIR